MYVCYLLFPINNNNNVNILRLILLSDLAGYPVFRTVFT